MNPANGNPPCWLARPKHGPAAPNTPSGPSMMPTATKICRSSMSPSTYTSGPLQDWRRVVTSGKSPTMSSSQKASARSNASTTAFDASASSKNTKSMSNAGSNGWVSDEFDVPDVASLVASLPVESFVDAELDGAELADCVPVFDPLPVERSLVSLLSEVEGPLVVEL